jgi:branched-chain amino acid aminotransferase
MADFTGHFYSEGIVYKEISSFDPAVFNSGTVLYEVIRILNGTALFLEDHFQRFQESIKLSGYTYTLSMPVIHYLLRNLIKKNNTVNGNVKVVIRLTANSEPVIYSYFIAHSYPTQSMYLNGVETNFFKAERVNPNIKKLNPGMIENVSTFIKTENLYDAILVTEEDVITEGSKTNIFFICEDTIYTAPGYLVLKGVTRQKVIQLCSDLRFPFKEEAFTIKKLHTVEAAFFTGTSPKILPVSRIANISMNVNNQLVRRLIHAYDDLITAYIYHW